MARLDLLKTLCNTPGVSGYEKDVAQVILSMLKDAPLDDMYVDSIGNIVCVSRGTIRRNKVMITSHMDEVGFQVIKPCDKGYMIKPLGCVKTIDAVFTRVESSGIHGTIRTDNREEYPYGYDSLYLRLDDGETETGAVFSFESNYSEDGESIFSKALDNRAGCYCMVNQILSGAKHDSDIYYVFTVQEEFGMRGARVARTHIQPNVLLSIDTTPALPLNSVELSKGVGITISDEGNISDPECVANLIRLAKNGNIPYQLEVSDYGWSEMIITNELDNGYKVMGLSIPCERMHCSKSKIIQSDLNACVMLLSEFVKDV